MAGPDKQFNRTETLKKAMDIFWAKGFAATSMQDLVNGMGINRASMYQTYGNKHKLYIAAIEQYIDDTLLFIKQELEDPDKPLLKLQNLLEQFVIGSFKNNMNGCLVNNAAVELGPYDKDIAKKARYFWSQFETTFASVLKQAASKGEISSKVDSEQFAVLINATLQGLMVKTKSNTSRKQLLNVLEALFELIKKS